MRHPTKTPISIEALAWPLDRLGEALEALAYQSKLISPKALTLTAYHGSSKGARLGKRKLPPSAPPELIVVGADNKNDTNERIGQWLDGVAHGFGLEIEPGLLRYPELELVLGHGGNNNPVLFRLPASPGFLAYVGGRAGQMRLLAPDRKIYRLPAERVRAVLCAEIEALQLPQIAQVLANVAMPPTRQTNTAYAILREQLNMIMVDGGWTLRLSPGSSFYKQLRQTHILRNMGLFGLGLFIFYALFLLSWQLIGQSTLTGRIELGWLVAWLLLLFSMIPARLIYTWMQAPIAISVGGLLKRRLLYGALRMDSETIRQQGVGELLGYVVESQAVETQLLSGGAYLIQGLIQSFMTLFILLSEPATRLDAVLFTGWLILVLGVGWYYWQQRLLWTELRLQMTGDLIESMAGHRTRQVQKAVYKRHENEDPQLQAYLTLSARLDRVALILETVAARGWLVLGLLALVPALLAGTNPTGIAIGVGGVLFGYNALAWTGESLPDLSGALIAWRRVAPIFHAGSDKLNSKESASGPIAATMVAISPSLSASEAKNNHDQTGRTLLEGHGLTFRYYAQGKPVLENCSLSIQRGERVLLEGPSGGGKSTLAALLAGLRQADSGVLLLDGLDRQTLGLEGWRQRVVAATQFHENFVLTETFAFNLLMGRRWPPRSSDLQEAEAICQELGLGDLLARMPAGLMQMVGETGWQLSHGERSRLYIARTLLQAAELVILDESFGALDPETLQQALRCVLARAKTLVVIAHP